MTTPEPADTLVVMVTVEGREEMLHKFLRSLARQQPGRPVAVHHQGAAPDIAEVVPDGVEIATWLQSPTPMGCHAARVQLLRHVHEQGITPAAFINVDDDVTLTPHTRWDPAIEHALQPGVGFVLTNWIKHLSEYPKAVERIRDEFLPQVMVYNGGGMAYGPEVAELMRELPAVPARFDDIWPLTAYLAGRRNYRYRGSLALHEIMRPGGMSTYMRAEPRPLLCEGWIDYRPVLGASADRNVAIPMDSDLRPAAREQHRAARASRGWA